MSKPAHAPTPERILHRLDWHIIRRLDGLLQGDYRGLLYGYGLDLADLREYQPGDDIRHIDWNVTARVQMPYVRQYIEEREVNAWFLLDLSPSMDFGPPASQKRAVLVDLVATFARLLTRHGNRVGAVLYGNRVEKVIPARSGRMHVLRLIHELMQASPAGTSSFTNLTPLLQTGLRSLKRRSLVFVISDFLCEPGWEKTLTLLSHRHEVLAIRLWDPREHELPAMGTMLLEDAETGEQIYVDTSDKTFRKRFHGIVQQREQTLSASFKHAGVDALPLSTEEDLLRAMVRFSQQRKRLRH